MSTLTRRDFIKASALTGGSLALGFMIGCTPEEITTTNVVNVSPTATEPPAPGLDLTATPAPTATPEPEPGFEPNAYLIIRPDGSVTVMAHRSEMGQGVNTSVPMIVAEELDAAWESISIVHAPADPVYGDQQTGGSQSISGSYDTLRMAGATARTMLIMAAANRWGVAPEDCTTERGTVRNGDQVLTYGELASAAAELPVPSGAAVTLKNPDDFTIIGTSRSLIDNPQYVNGSAIFASDMVLEGMLYAVIARSPVVGGTVVSFDASAANAVDGVEQVFQVYGGVAVLATSTWAALKGRDALEITWSEGSSNLSTESIREVAGYGFTLRGEDDHTMEAVYEVPYLAHATMEPMTCVAHVQADRCDVWAPTQDRQSAKQIATLTSGLPSDNVFVHVPLIGGGFGRRLQSDYVSEAVEISAQAGRPVKLFWSREDDIRNDYYHPLSLNYRYADLDTLSIRGNSSLGPGLQTGAWRSVENFPEAFAANCFQDEVAARVGLDPYELRMQSLNERQQGVLRLAAEKAGWGQPLPEGHAHGIAVHSTFGVTHVAQIAEVSIEDGEIRVHKVTCAVDCGRVINPDGVIAQMESGIIFGMTAALYGEITLEDGQIRQSNFHDYRLVRMPEAPVIDVHILETDNSPTGIGEMGVPPIAPAIANAIFALTGNPVRKLPIRLNQSP
jgi:isoquinoline 1-oxidoreductase beta subunit